MGLSKRVKWTNADPCTNTLNKVRLRGYAALSEQPIISNGCLSLSLVGIHLAADKSSSAHLRRLAPALTPQSAASNPILTSLQY